MIKKINKLNSIYIGELKVDASTKKEIVKAKGINMELMFLMKQECIYGKKKNLKWM